MKKSLESKKSWFATIRAGRMVYQDTIIQDEFAKKGPLQQWAGLSSTLFPSKREQKHIDNLNTSIKDEWNKGIGNLPTSSYSQFFRGTLEEIRSKPLQLRKDWFTTIRGGRMRHNHHTSKDIFAKRGRLQQCVGLQFSLYSL